MINSMMYDIPNSGSRLYPVSVCLKMVLDYKGDSIPMYKIENISGHPYGWFYLNNIITGESNDLEISPGTELTNSIKVAAKVLGYEYEYYNTDKWTDMEKIIKKKVEKRQPIIFGPIAFSKLTYQISSFRAPDVASHYIVIAGYDNNCIYFHDPNGMSYIPVSFSELESYCTQKVKIPGTKLYSAITIEDKIENNDEFNIFKRVIHNAVESYQEKKVRGNGYVGLHAILEYAKDITEWLGAKNQKQRELVFRKLGLYFYPKGNQIRSDAVTYIMNTKKYLSINIHSYLDDFCDAFYQASILYKKGAQLLTPKLVYYNEGNIKETLRELQQDAYKLYELEKTAFDTILTINNRL